MTPRRAAGLALGALLFGTASSAAAARPTLSGPELTYGVTGGRVLVHYTRQGADAVPTADGDGDNVPDFVEDVAMAAEEALTRYAADGFLLPLPDGALGGDARLDVYLEDLISADGNTGLDSCSGSKCTGHAVAENDYAGFSYPTVLEGIRSVVPHELFHLVQWAYDDSQPIQWVEGTAVWAVEHLYGDGNSDFERFVPSFLARPFRPFERDAGGFGDAYPYGAALFPYYLEHRFGVAAVVAAWTAIGAGAEFLEAIDGADAAYTEFTRWNWFTGSRAASGMYPGGAATWPEVPLEGPLAGTDTSAETTIQIEGMSARYVPVILGPEGGWDVRVRPSGRTLRAWLVAANAAFADGVELEADDEGTLVAHVDSGGPRQHTLVVTGLSRNTITTAIPVAIAPAVDEPPGGEAGGCCAAGGRPNPIAIVIVAFALLRRRR